MKFFFKPLSSAEIMTYTKIVLQKIIIKSGHEITDKKEEADAILVTISDVNEIEQLEKVRKNTDKLIIAGGHFCVHFKLVSLFSDIVNVGQGFEIFRCKTLSEIYDQDFVYFKGKDTRENPIKPSTYINWSIVPCALVSKSKSRQKYIYWAGVGCKNKCHFCMTAWTNKRQANSNIRIKKLKEKLPAKSKIQLVSNEINDSNESRLINDILKKKKINYNNIQVGLEFCKEENRKKYLGKKAFSHQDLLKFIDILERNNINATFYCMSGIESENEWLSFFYSLGENPKKGPIMKFTFNNIDYIQFTPFFKNVHKINTNNLFSHKTVDKFFEKICMINRRIRFSPPKYGANSIYRTGLMLCTTLGEYKNWKKEKNNKDAEDVKSKLFESQLLKNTYTDEIEINLK